MLIYVYRIKIEQRQEKECFYSFLRVGCFEGLPYNVKKSLRHSIDIP